MNNLSRDPDENPEQRLLQFSCAQYEPLGWPLESRLLGLPHIMVDDSLSDRTRSPADKLTITA